MVYKLVILLTITSCAIIIPIWANDNEKSHEGEEEHQNSFLVPAELDEDADRFRKDNRDYYFVQIKLNYYLATHLCANKYFGRLAWIRTLDLAEFLSEALTETRLDMDTLWTGGRKEDEETPWNWQQGHKKEPIAENITKDIVTISEVEANDRHCLGFGRSYHDLPQFRGLACGVERSVLCESHQRPPDLTGSSHPGWIAWGKYEYKIFRNRVTWNQSNVECGNIKPNVKLAMVLDYQTAQELGRYLLIGRPSLENAWIAGKWNHNSYVWMETRESLHNERNDTTNYPPWKDEKVKKRSGCILLDRHLADTTLFVEARCERQRAYICYRESPTLDIVRSTDVIFGTDGYRMIYNQKSWDEAVEYCLYYKNYQSRLVEIRSEEMANHLLYIMGDNRTSVQHIWIAGRFQVDERANDGEWVWISDNSTISNEENSGLHWIQNTTFSNEVEEMNVCLNMDRENHKTAFHYGTSCTEPQSFVCYFPHGEILLLQEDERNGDVHTSPPMF